MFGRALDDFDSLLSLRFCMDEYEATGFCVPAKLGCARQLTASDCVTGDWTGVVRTSKTSFRLALGDLCGKGDGASVYHEYMGIMLKEGRSSGPLQWLADIDQNWPGDRFMSLVIVDVDTARHEATFVTAGHPYPIVRAPTGRAHPYKANGLGLIGLQDCLDGEMVLAENLMRWNFPIGGSCVLVTDGVLDAGVHTGDPFGTDRLKYAVDSAEAGDGLAVQIARDVFQHTGNEPPCDDLAAIVISRRPPTPTYIDLNATHTTASTARRELVVTGA